MNNVKTIKKICFVMDSFGVGGVEINRVKIMNWYANQGYDVSLVCLLRGGDSIEELNKNITTYFLSCEKKRIFAPLRLWRHLIKNNYDYVISAKELTNLVTMVAFLILPIRKSRKPKVILSTHIAISEQFKYTSSGLLKSVFRFLPFFYKRADKLICVSQAGSKNLETFLNLSEGTVTTVLNPVVKSEWLSLEPLAAPDELFNSDSFVFVACGRLTYQKNFQLLLEAFHVAYQERQDIRLLIIGEGEDRLSLEKTIEELMLGDIVMLVGQKSNVLDYLYYAHSFVLSSRYEGLPTVLIESFAMGTPVIATDCPTGPQEIIDSKNCGFLVENNSPQKLANAIVRSCEFDFADKATIRKRAQSYTVAKQAPKYIEGL